MVSVAVVLAVWLAGWSVGRRRRRRRRRRHRRVVVVVVVVVVLCAMHGRWVSTCGGKAGPFAAQAQAPAPAPARAPPLRTPANFLHIYIYIYVCIYVYIYVHRYPCMFIYICIYVYLYIFAKAFNWLCQANAWHLYFSCFSPVKLWLAKNMKSRVSSFR